MNRDSLAVFIGAVIAVAAQAILAPNMTVFSAMPNFILVYVLVVAIVRPTPSVFVMAFVLGFLYDLMGYGPVGLMALLLLAASFAASQAFRVLNNDTLFMPLTIFIITALAIELLYAVFLLGFGLLATPFEAFVLKVLPNTLYDCVIGVIVYLLVTRLIPQGGSLSMQTPTAHSVQATASALPKNRHKRSSIRKR